MMEKLSNDADGQIFSDRISDKTEILDMLTRLMRGEELADTSRIRATQLLAQAQELLRDPNETVLKEKTSDEIRDQLIEKLKLIQCNW